MIPLTDLEILAEQDRDLGAMARQLAEALEHNTALRAEVGRLTEALADLGVGVAL